MSSQEPRPKKQKRAYADELNDKIPSIKIQSGSVLAEKAPSIDGSHIPTAWLSKMLLLLDHYEINRDDPEKWFALSLQLAIAHVPGFAVDQHKSPGAKAVWDETTLTRLYVEVKALVEERRKSNPKFSESNACTILANKEPWKSMHRKPSNETLRRRYYAAADSPLIKLAEGIRTTPQIGHLAERFLRTMAGLQSFEEFEGELKKPVRK